MATITSLGFSIFSRYNGDGMRRAREDVERTQRSVKFMNRETRLLTDAIVGLGPAVIPITAALTGGFLAAGAAMTQAALGLGIFAAAAKSQLGGVINRWKELEQAREAFRKALSQEQRDKALDKMEIAMKGMTAQQQLAILKIDELRDNWNKFGATGKNVIIDIFSSGINMLITLMKRLEPVVLPVAKVIRSLFYDLESGVGGPGFKKFVTWLSITAPRAIFAFILAGKNFAAAFYNIFIAVSHTDWGSTGFLEWIVKISVAFRNWTAGPAILNFMHAAQTAMPIVRDFLVSVLSLANALAKALGPAGISVLKVLTPLANMLATLATKFPGLVQAMWGFYTVTRLTMIALAAFNGALLFLNRSVSMSAIAVMRLKQVFAGVASFLSNPWGVAITVAVGALYVLWQATRNQKQAVDEWTDAIKQDSYAIGENTRAAVVNRLEKQKVLEQAQELGINLTKVTDAVLGDTRAMQELRTQLQQIIQSWKDGTGATHAQAIAAQNLLGQLDRMSGSLNASNDAAQRQKAALGQATTATNGMTSATRSNTMSLNEQYNAVMKNANAFNTDEQQAIQFREAIDRATAALKTNGTTLSLHTQKGRENRSAILNAADAINRHAQSLISDNRFTEESRKKLMAQKEELIKVAEKFFGSRKKAEEYINALIKIPKSVHTDMSMSAKGKVDIFMGDIKQRVREQNGGSFAGGGVISRAGGGQTPRMYPTGGKVNGYGGPRSDRVPTWLSPGEFVVNAKSTRQHMGLLKAINNKGNKNSPYTGAYSPNGLSDRGFAAGGGWNLSVKDGPSGIIGQHTTNSVAAYNKMKHDAIQAMIKATRDAIKKAQAELMTGDVTWANASGRLMRALAWARTQNGLPYQWGGNGNPSWDCSGFMAAIESVIRGQSPHRRYTTFDFQGSSAPAGWVRGLTSPFMVGVTNAGVGHMAGTLLGIAVESSGSKGVKVGGSARSASNGMFPNRYGFAPVVREATPKAGGGLTMRKYKDGGRMRPFEVGMVGEQGPELIRAGQAGATVSPASGVTIIFKDKVYVKSEKEFRDMVATAVQEATRKKRL